MDTFGYVMDIKMKKILPYILLLIVFGGLLYMWMDADSGHEREVLKLKRELFYTRQRMETNAKKAEEWRLKALQYGEQYRKEATKALQGEQRLSYALEENRILKRRVIRYSEPQLDSVFSARYPK